jgi:adenosine deaminase
VELHVHLEGAMRPRTLLALARRRRVTLPANDEAGLREWFRFRDFDHFVDIYVTCRSARPGGLPAAAGDFAVDQAAENIRYWKSISPSGRTGRNGVAIDEVLDAMVYTIVASSVTRTSASG